MGRLGWLVLVVSSFALAQTPRELFDEGAALYAKGQFANAAQKFEASFAARPVPVTKFNTARAWEQAGETLKAIDAWQAWLLMSPSAPERPDAERSLKTLGDKLARLGVQAVTITSLPLGAQVSIDGAKAGVTPLTVELPPTRHLLRVDAEGRVPQERAVVTQLERPAIEFFELASSAPQASATPTGAERRDPLPLPSPTQPRSTDPEFAFAMADDVVRVHIETTDRDVRLLRLNGNPNGECRAPCDAPVTRASDHFVVTGAEISPSNSFVLADHAHRNRVALRVRGGGRGWVTATILFTTLAVSGLALALGFGIGGLSGRSNVALPVGLGFTFAVAGGVGLAVSIPLGTTKVTFEK